MKLRHQTAKENITLDMTSMIDIVFQLLIFFIMTFKIVEQEGDFNIRMPSAAPSEGIPDEEQMPPMRLRMVATDDGSLGSMQLNDRQFDSFNALHEYIRGLVGDDQGPSSVLDDAEIELDCDYDLRYENVIEAITSVSGHRTEDGTVIKLVEKIKFSPPKKPS